MCSLFSVFSGFIRVGLLFRQMLPERDKRKSQINIDHVVKKIKKHKKKTITSKQQSNANKPRKNRKQRTHGPMKYGLKSGVPD
jgi:L-2-hydroxyglutarate oxidase LhgO